MTITKESVYSKYVGKKIFLRTNLNRVYAGQVIRVDIEENNSLMTIDTEKGLVTILTNQIVEIKEEK